VEKWLWFLYMNNNIIVHINLDSSNHLVVCGVVGIGVINNDNDNKNKK